MNKDKINEITDSINLIKELSPRLGHEIEQQLASILGRGLNGDVCLDDFLEYVNKQAEHVIDCDDLGFYDKENTAIETSNLEKYYKRVDDLPLLECLMQYKQYIEEAIDEGDDDKELIYRYHYDEALAEAKRRKICDGVAFNDIDIEDLCG